MKTRLHNVPRCIGRTLLGDRADARRPWRLFPAFVLGFWLTDTVVGTVSGHHDSLRAEFFSLNPHEVFMRLAIVLVIALSAHMWSRSIVEQNKRIEALEQAEVRLRTVAAALAAGDAENRRSLGGRLHENVGQTLSAAQMYLASIDAASQAPHEAKLLRSAALIIGGAISECRDIAQDLAPSGLESYGLNAALETLRERMMKRTGVSIELRSDEASCALGSDAMLAAFQALSDTIELAAEDPLTSLVEIDAARDGSDLHFIVSWDAPSPERSLGSYEWLRVVGGSVCRVASEQPSALRLSVPLTAAA